MSEAADRPVPGAAVVCLKGEQVLLVRGEGHVGDFYEPDGVGETRTGRQRYGQDRVLSGDEVPGADRTQDALPGQACR